MWPASLSATQRSSNPSKRSSVTIPISQEGGCVSRSVAETANRTGISSLRRKFANGLLQAQAGVDPQPPDLPVADAKQLGDLGLRPAVVKRAGKDLAPVRRQAFDSLVQGGPALQLGRAVGLLWWVALEADGRPARVVAGQVKQFALDLHGRQAEEFLDRPRRLLPQRPCQPDQGILKDVVGFFLGPHGR